MQASLRDDRGQMTVELCVALPVLMVVAAIAFNALTFFGECAKFDRLSRNAIVAQASCTSESSTTEQIASEVVDSIQSEINGEVAIETSGYDNFDGGIHMPSDYATFRLTYEYSPTLFGLGVRDEVLGVRLPKLTHSIGLVVDTYTPGKWVWSYVD